MITDTQLIQLAKALNNESYTIASHLAVTTDTDFTADATSTDIGTELGGRIATTNSRINTTTSYSAVRSGAIVVEPTGDVLTGVGLFSNSSGGDLEVTIPLPSLSHTTGFDIEFDFDITVSRR